MLNLTLWTIQINCDYDNLNCSLTMFSPYLVTKVKYYALVEGSFYVVHEFVFQINPSFIT